MLGSEPVVGLQQCLPKAVVSSTCMQDRTDAYRLVTN